MLGKSQLKSIPLNNKGMSIVEVLVVSGITFTMLMGAMVLFNTQMRNLKFLEDKMAVVSHGHYLTGILSDTGNCGANFNGLDPSDSPILTTIQKLTETSTIVITDTDDASLSMIPGTNLNISSMTLMPNEATTLDPDDYVLSVSVANGSGKTPIRPINIPLFLTLDGSNLVTDCSTDPLRLPADVDTTSTGTGSGGGGGGGDTEPSQGAMEFGGTYDICILGTGCPCAIAGCNGSSGSGITDCWGTNTQTGTCSCPDGFSARPMGLTYHHQDPDGQAFICVK